MEFVEKLLAYFDFRTTTAMVIGGGLVLLVVRTWLTKRIEADISKAISKELAEHSHKLTLEVEAYRTSLLRDLEQARADIDIKRSVALQNASAKLEALRKLHAASMAGVDSALGFAISEIADREAREAAVLAKSETAYAALGAADIFLPGELRARVRDLHASLIDAVLHNAEGGSVAGRGSKEIASIRTEADEVHRAIRMELEALVK